MKHYPLIERQRGLVLLVAMIALVVLSLAAVALIRTVDSATIIAGNLAFKQSATSSGEAALIRANQWLAAQAAVEPPVGLYNDNLSVGYYATMTSLTTARGFTPDQVIKALTDDATWSDANSRAALVKCNGVDSDKDCSGNTIRYVIERMCSSSGPAGTEQCLFGPDVESGSSKKGGSVGGQPKTASPMFRITARSVGPKNTVGYIQSFVY